LWLLILAVEGSCFFMANFIETYRFGTIEKKKKYLNFSWNIIGNLVNLVN